MPVTYEINRPISVEQFRDVLAATSLGERRPLDDTARMTRMLANANLVVTAWDGDLLVGVSRCFSDFAYVTYCSDLAVRESHQRLGIGKQLLKRTSEAGGCRIVLLAAPKAMTYYPHIGLEQHPSAWTLAEGVLK